MKNTIAAILSDASARNGDQAVARLSAEFSAQPTVVL
jgi:hypothetical protein